MAIKQFFFGLFGSFQARLATDPDPTDFSPDGPNPAFVSNTPIAALGPFSRPGSGWTYDFGEPTFDRVIRTAAPVSLRNALMDNWLDVTVGNLKVDRGTGFKDLVGDPFSGAPVSFGSGVKFDSAAGGGTSKEALTGFELTIGKVFKAKPATAPQIVTDMNISQASAWTGEYKTRKQQLAGGITGNLRREVLKWRMDNYAYFFGSAMGTVDGFVLPAPTISHTTGVLAEVAAQTKADLKKAGRWELHIDFFRFDGDTLCGQTNGWIVATF